MARKCPVDIFAEAAISKEYLSAEDRSQVNAWASLGMLGVADVVEAALPQATLYSSLDGAKRPMELSNLV
ncbi:hypothetical protein [Desulfosporosinus meridiei]|uniref:hypothetical protein n=1 Tax=Desulfosporosinus meridiei TaxID=79209 RepID=UPI0011D25E3A|nr:hypothetical protein [Desulfosporosinus meridiei]